MYLQNYLILFSENEDDLVKIIKIEEVIPVYYISGNPVCALAAVLDKNDILDYVPSKYKDLVNNTNAHIYYSVCATEYELYRSIKRKIESNII